MSHSGKTDLSGVDQLLFCPKWFEEEKEGCVDHEERTWDNSAHGRTNAPSKIKAPGSIWRCF